MNTFPVTGDTALQLLRQLPPRERLRVVVHVLPELEHGSSAALLALNFWHGADVRVLAERQGVRPVDNFDALLGGWPEDEPIDDFIVAVREWRRRRFRLCRERLWSR